VGAIVYTFVLVLLFIFPIKSLRMAQVRLFNHYVHAPYLILGLCEFFLLVIAAHLAFYFRFSDQYRFDLRVDDIWIVRSVIFAAVMSICTHAMGVYHARIAEGFVSSAIKTVVSFCLLGGGSLTILYYMVSSLYLGRGVLLLAVLNSLLLVLVFRYLYFTLIDKQQLKSRVIVIGAGQRAAELKAELERAGGTHIDLLGFVRAGEKDVDVPEEQLLSIKGGWRDQLQQKLVNEVVIALDERRRGLGALFPVDELLDCKMRGISVVDGITFLERETGKIELEFLYSGWLLFSDSFRYSQLRNMIKRCFDVVASLLLVLLVWPLMLLTALAVFFESGGPVLYRQERVGLNGKVFQVIKFRSMVVNAEKDGGAVWATSNDSRVTWVGAFIRNTRLDELPQIYNILKGDMSFVGPRPERPEFVTELAKEIPYYEERHYVKPGLMGWAQLNYPYGASVEDSTNKLRYDLYYIKNQSVFLDLLILVQTVEVVLLGKGVR
jgi:sugar transferase (PEP-CTERM system associated)